MVSPMISEVKKEQKNRETLENTIHPAEGAMKMSFQILSITVIEHQDVVLHWYLQNQLNTTNRIGFN